MNCGIAYVPLNSGKLNVHKTFKRLLNVWCTFHLRLVFRGSRCSENMLQSYRRTPMPKCDFKPKCHFNKLETLLKSDFGMGVLIFSEYLFLRTRLAGCFWIGTVITNRENHYKLVLYKQFWKNWWNSLELPATEPFFK